MNQNSPKPAVPDDFLTPSRLRALKIAVVVMGIIILLLMTSIIARIIYLASAKPKPLSAADSAAVTTPPLADLTLALPAGAVIRSTMLSGTQLAVQHSAGDQDAITILDLTTGKVVSRIKIERNAK